MNLIKKHPFAMSGLVLAFAALGNLLASYSPILRLIMGAIAIILFIPLTIRLFTDFSSYREEMKHPLPASTFPTYPMAMMLIATYLTPLLRIPANIAEIFWWIGLIFNLYLFIKYIIIFVAPRTMKNVFPSWGVVFVGFVVGSVTAPIFENQAVGQFLFWLGLIGGIIVMPFMLYRTYIMKNLPAPGRPAITVLCAPFSLLVAGYVQSFQGQHNLTLLAILLVFAQLLYFTTVVQVPGFIGEGFKPTFAAMTFPVVISALSLKLAIPVLGWESTLASLLILIETIVAVAVVFYVFYTFIKHIFLTP